MGEAWLNLHLTDLPTLKQKTWPLQSSPASAGVPGLKTLLFIYLDIENIFSPYTNCSAWHLTKQVTFYHLLDPALYYFVSYILE